MFVSAYLSHIKLSSHGKQIFESKKMVRFFSIAPITEFFERPYFDSAIFLITVNFMPGL